ncbi:MAG: LysM peptidoglycan-binding domain-containing protein [Salinibacterium sp.]|nr:LysM peptidoglycan-binding domain-containing protein [Salinibacterium sp.]
MAAMTLNLTGPVEAADARPTLKPRGSAMELGKTIREAMAAANSAIKSTAASLVRTVAAPAPVSYTVAAGDTISSIAGQFGLSTASVLALNGLGWSSIIFPGQVLTLGTPVAPVAAAPVEISSTVRYTILAGDTITSIAQRFGVPTAAVLSANGLGPSSLIFPDQTLAIPSDVAPASPTAPEIAVDLVAHSAPLATGGSYTIVSGDTIGSIATRHGVSEQALLEANALQATSLIFSGDTLTLPGSAAAPTSIAPAASGSSIAVMTDEMRGNAAVIVAVGHELGVPGQGIVIALATAMQESTLRNLDWGDRDSVGLFQQRPSTGWGSVEQLTTPDYAARLFYGGSSNPNAGITRGLLDITGWESMPLTVAAQSVQISAFPDAYASWEASAQSWYAELG